MIIIDILIIFICIFGLWLGAVWVVDSASKIAKKLGLSELVIGLTVVAIATSAPEFAVTVSAALKGQAAISVGNVVGSNIFNLGIILGLVAIFSSIKTSRELLYRDGFLLFGTSILLLIFFWDLNLSLMEGIILFSVLIIYLIVLAKQKKTFEEELPGEEYKWFDIPKLIIGIATIIVSAHYFVDSASEVARFYGVSEWLIGITIVAAGTSAPELATSVVAVFKGKHGLSIGNLIGSDLFNLLGVLGVASILRPLPIEQSDYISMIFMAITLVIILVMIRTGWKISKSEGILLLIIAFARWYLDFAL